MCLGKLRIEGCLVVSNYEGNFLDGLCFECGFKNVLCWVKI